MLLSVLAAVAALQVPAGDVLVSDISGHVRIVDRGGHVVRLLDWTLERQVEALELTPDRRGAYVSLYLADAAPELFLLDLTTGLKQKLDDGTSPALSPDKTRIAYVRTELRDDLKLRTALVIRNLHTGRVRSYPFDPVAPLGTPPELVINWSPDGHTIALFDGLRVRLLGSTLTKLPQRAIAPVFLDRRTLVVLTHCCIGPQRLVAVDLRSGKATRFATLSSPVEQVRGVGASKLLVVTALNELAFVSRGQVRVVARRIVAAAP